MWFIIPLLLSLAITIVSNSFNVELLLVSSDDSFHFGIITVCSIFSGFLYTNYGILLDFSETRLGEKLKGTNIIQKRNKHISHGIFTSVISITAGLLLTIDVNSKISTWVNNHLSWAPLFVYYVEIIFAFITIFLFIKSLQEMKILIEQKGKTQQQIDTDTIEKIQKQRERM